MPIDRHRLPMESSFLRNCPASTNLVRMPLNDLFVSFVPASPPLIFLPLWCECALVVARDERSDVGRADWRRPDGSLPAPSRLSVSRQVIAFICKWKRSAMWSAWGAPRRIASANVRAAVARDDLHIGVLAKPGGHRFLFAVG